MALEHNAQREAADDRACSIVHTERALSPIPLMQLATGFWAFKTLAAAHEFDLFSRLSGTAGTTIEGLAEQLEIEERPAEMLLTGCAALGLLAKNDGRYVNGPLAEEFLVRGKPYYFTGSSGRERIYDSYPDVALEMISSRTFDGRIQLLEYVPTILAGPPGTSRASA